MTTRAKPQAQKQCIILEKGEALSTADWFAHKNHTYPPRQNALIKPLLTGEKTLKALSHAINNAKLSIDIIIWGYNESLKLDGPKGSETIHQLLSRKHREGAKVRILVWSHKIPLLFSGTKQGPPDPEEITFKTVDYYRVNSYVSGYNDQNKASAATGFDVELSSSSSISVHQKMVLIDYENPEDAIGFIMGQNLREHYYDTEMHHFDPGIERFGTAKPFQDISGSIRGGCLMDLNHNFCLMWTAMLKRAIISKKDFAIAKEASQTHFNLDDDQIIRRVKEISNRYKSDSNETPHIYPASSEDQQRKIGEYNLSLYEERSKFDIQYLNKTFKKTDDEFFCEAQVCRTMPKLLGSSPLPRDLSIWEVHQKAFNNVTDFIYIEDQYFRMEKLTEYLVELGKKRQACGAKDLYLFVVTEIDKEIYGYDKAQKTLSLLGQKERVAQSKLKYKDNRTEKREDTMVFKEIAGLKVLVATLTASNPNIDGQYKEFFTHSKLRIIDDVFVTFGSANYNKRSMATDPELNIASPCPELAASMRTSLWMRYAKVLKPNSEENFEYWTESMDENWTLQFKGMPLKNFLTHYFSPREYEFFNFIQDSD